MRKACLVLVSLFLAVSAVYADTGVTVNFPSDTSFYCSATNGCGFIGSNGGVTAAMWTTGDFVTETFFTGQWGVNDLSAGFGVVDYYGGVPGATYENDVYINGTLVGYFLLPDCDFCGTLYTVSGTVYFPEIYGQGTYNLSIVLAQTAATGAGSEWFSSTTTDGSPSTALLSTPEPGSMTLLGTGVLGVVGFLRRKFWS